MLKAIKLRFTSPVHFGRGREELDRSELVYHSDSLKSALYSVGLSVFNEWSDAGYFFDGFRISSCFPFAKDEYFLPKPQLRREIELVNFNKDLVSKKVKKIEYLEKSIFEKFVSDIDKALPIDPEFITSDGLFVCKSRDTFLRKAGNKSIPVNFYKSEVQQRVTLPKHGEEEQESKPFYIDRINFEENCGLYFLAEFSNPDLEFQVFTALKLLGEQGIGTDRTVGNGQFEFEPGLDVTDFPIDICKTTGKHLSLGLFLPSESDYQNINMKQSSWNILKRGGYMAGSEFEDFRHLRKKTLFMFSLGSILHSDHELNGQFVNVAPAWNDTRMHPVWRDGKCLLIKI
ncbi:MAG TPA: type III-A CRISPR-associated RAMP protein Csm4 [Bacteroidales bacterium]|nr:type III-A CRISPR-associated RAMP protein Csm4 [Bacteroidales bacterium]